MAKAKVKIIECAEEAVALFKKSLEKKLKREITRFRYDLKLELGFYGISKVNQVKNNLLISSKDLFEDLCAVLRLDPVKTSRLNDESLIDAALAKFKMDVSSIEALEWAGLIYDAGRDSVQSELDYDSDEDAEGEEDQNSDSDEEENEQDTK